LVIGGVLGLVVGVVMDYGPFALSIPGAILGLLVGTFLISQSFVRVTIPLALPGIFAGSLLTFIPAVGDFVNAELLGNPQSLMIGNVIQARYLQVTDYPTASALSFILMLAILIGLIVYTRLLGTEDLTGASI
jgi:ABC-type spermidine/putrescine transport system permease subunit I